MKRERTCPQWEKRETPNHSFGNTDFLQGVARIGGYPVSQDFGHNFRIADHSLRTLPTDVVTLTKCDGATLTPAVEEWYAQQDNRQPDR